MLLSPWLLTPLLAIVIIVAAVSASIAHNPRTCSCQRFRHTTELLMYVFAFGITFKYMLIGPDYIRWHLSDVGLPMCLILLAARFRMATYRFGEPVRDGEATRRSVIEARVMERYTPWVFVLCLTYELASEVLLSSRFSYMGGFDIVDVVCYALGSSLLWAVCRYYRAITEPRIIFADVQGSQLHDA